MYKENNRSLIRQLIIYQQKFQFHLSLSQNLARFRIESFGDLAS